VNDFVFKQYIHRGSHPLGLFVVGVGVVWTAVFGAGMLATNGGLTGVGWPIALGAGLASVVANLLFIASFRSVPAGTGATIYRLNLVGVAILGVALLGEPLTGWKVLGIMLGGAAVLLIRNGHTETTQQLARAGLLALAVACGLRAIMGILYKVSSTAGVPPFEMLTMGGVCWIIGGMAFALGRGENLRPDRRVMGFALLSGLLVCGITHFMLAATQLGEASVVVPITQLSFIVTMILGMTFHREPLVLPKAFALAAAVACILSLARG
jgi:drug/metabolite transporter (DMT)-like permease